MKKNIDKYEIISNYISSCKIIQEATLSGDYKINNAEGKKIIKVFQILEKDLKLADDCLGILLENNSIVVKTKAAAHCLALNIRVEEAVKILQYVADSQENGIFGFNAQMTLNVWKEQGYLRVYQK